MGPTQYGSRKRRSCHDSIRQLKDFLEYYKDRGCVVMTTDVAGGFDNINTDLLLDMLGYQDCHKGLIE